MAVLEVRDLGIRFGGLQALDALSFRAERHEIVGIMGPNGAGKTTTFNCVSGFYTADAGTVEFEGTDITALRPHERAALGLGRTFQQVGLVRTMSVLDNVLTAQHGLIRQGLLAGLLPTRATVTQERAVLRRALEVLDFMGLADLRDEPLGGLPYGTLKLIETAAVLATSPSLLLLDEPSAGMSPEESHDFGRMLTAIRDWLGVTVVMIEHHVPLVVGVSDYVYVLNFGRLLAEGKPAAVREHPEVIAAYFGQEDTYGAG